MKSPPTACVCSADRISPSAGPRVMQLNATGRVPGMERGRIIAPGEKSHAIPSFQSFRCRCCSCRSSISCTKWLSTRAGLFPGDAQNSFPSAR